MTKDVQSLAKEWFEFAEKDLQAAKMLFKEINYYLFSLSAIC